jgi:hypothetical protein
MTLLRWAVLVCGAAVLAVAAVGAARGWSSTGLWILVVAGAVCLLMALIADKITGIVLKHGNTTLQVELDKTVQADLEVTSLAGAAGIYSFVHNQLGNDPSSKGVKVKLQDQIVAMVKEKSFSQHVDPKSVDEILKSGSPAVRVLVFGLLQGDGTLVTVERLRKGIMESKSGNEQYHALLATQMHWSTFSPDEKEELRGYVKEAPYIKEDPDRKNVADEILAAGR